jgi:PncC family amidohydrolase
MESVINSLAQAVGDLLQKNGLALAVAESCTGGLLGTLITNTPGSSAYFEGGVIAYSDEVKQQILGVPRDTLEQHGAVSPETAIAMAKGARTLLRTDLALATTGIAGPSGGTPEKPVGLVFIALASANGTTCKRYCWPGDRWQNREWSAQAALALLHEHLAALGTPQAPHAQPNQEAPPPSKCQATRSPAMHVEVEARFEQPDRPVPLAFKWQGRWLPVSSVGRTWTTGEGRSIIQHYVVSTPVQEVFELAFEPATMRWHVVRRTSRPAMA